VGTFDRLREVLDAVDAELVTAQTDLAECRAASEDLAAQVQSLTADMADRDAQIVALKAQIDAITQQPAPTPATIWGASSIAPGGSGTAAVQRVLDRWGSDIAVRLFVSGGFSTPDIPDGVKLLHISWKPDHADLVAGKLDDQIAAVVAWALALIARGIRVFVEVWHEPDVKTRKSNGTRDLYAASKAYFHQKVKALDPAVLTANTLSGWTFTASSGIDPEPWALDADYLGVDLDGLNSTKAYPDYQTVADRVAQFAADHGYAGWCVPELGEPRLASDPDGTQRAAWLSGLVDRIESDGAIYAALYEFTSGATGYQLNDVEMAAVKAAIS